MSTIYCRIDNGTYRGYEICGTFPLIKPYVEKKTKFVTVALIGVEGLPQDFPKARVQVEENDFAYVDENGNEVDLSSEEPEVEGVFKMEEESSAEREYREQETDQEAMDRMGNTFEVMELIAQGCARGQVRGLIVTGPPGVGKTHGVLETLKEESRLSRLREEGDKFYIINGQVTPIYLYQMLWDYKERGQVLLLDDADVWADEDTLRLLKSALDDKKVRTVSWLSNSRILKDLDIPTQFEFEGSIIFLTNLDPSDVRSQKLRKHLDALHSRCLFMDIGIKGSRDRLLRIRQVMEVGLLNEFDFNKKQEKEIFDFIEQYFDDMHEQSLRAVKNVAELYDSHPNRWQDIAMYTVMKKSAMWKALLEQKNSKQKKGKRKVA